MRELGIGRLVLLCAALLLPTRSGAESDFSRLNTQGEQAYQNGQFGDAANLLQQAYAIKPVPALLFNIARAYERMGNDEQAIRFYQRYLDAQGTDAETVKKAARALDLLRSRAAEKEIEQAKAAQEKAAQEKAAQAKAVEEKAAAEKAAQEKAAREPTAPAKAPAPPVAVVASPPPAPRPSLVPGGVLLGVGVVAAVAGVGLGVSANNEANSFNQTFDPVQRPARRQSALNLAHAADACYAGGVVAGGVGVFLLVRALTSAGQAPEGPTAALLPGGAALAWSGSW